jgi:hypothetical protein
MAAASNTRTVDLALLSDLHRIRTMCQFSLLRFTLDEGALFVV